MHARGTALSLLLLSQLALVLIASLLPQALVRRLFVALALLLPLLLFRHAPKDTPRPRLLKGEPKAFLFLLLLPAFILTVLGTSVGWGALAKWLGITLTSVSPMPNLAAALLFDALLPAVCEEIFCRGAVYAILRPLGRRAAIPLSALVFALMHANAAQIPYAFVAGLCLGALYELSGCLLLPILFHFASNALSLFLMHGLPVGGTVLLLSVLAAAGCVALLLLRRRLPHLAKEAPVPFRNVAADLASPALLLWFALCLTLTLL